MSFFAGKITLEAADPKPPGTGSERRAFFPRSLAFPVAISVIISSTSPAAGPARVDKTPP